MSFEQSSESNTNISKSSSSPDSVVQRSLPNNVIPTGAVLAMKPEATAIGDPQDGRWKITLTFDGHRFCIPKFRSSTLQQTTRQWRHWWFPTTSGFGVTNHSEAALLWLVRQERATINSGSPPSWDVIFWQWSVASPSEMGWLGSNVSRYLSVLCVCSYQNRRSVCESFPLPFLDTTVITRSSCYFTLPTNNTNKFTITLSNISAIKSVNYTREKLL